MSSCGYWPGGEGEGFFYSYVILNRPGTATQRSYPTGPSSATLSASSFSPMKPSGTAADPDGLLLGFLQSSYEAAADRAGWDRWALERHPRES